MGIFDFFKKNKNSAPIEVEKKTVDIEESKIIEENKSKPRYQKIELSGNKHVISDPYSGFEYEIDDTFKETKSHAGEVEVISVYAPDREDWSEADIPSVYVLIDDTIYSAIEEYREKETYSEAISFEKADGLFLFKANIKYYDMMMYFYAFEVEKETYTDEHGLCVCYPTEYVGTAEEEKLKSLLDEVAESFKLI